MSATVLVVDDHREVRRVLDRMLGRAGYSCHEAGSVAEARSELARYRTDLVLCDIDMPGESGIALLDHVAHNHPGTAVVMVTAHDEVEVAERALDAGAFGYVIKPFDRNEILISVGNALRRRSHEQRQRDQRHDLEELVDEKTAALHDRVEQLALVTGDLSRSHEDMIRRLVCAAEYRDPETASHLERMSRFCALLGETIGLPGDHCELLRLAAPMHDVGKIGIPDHVLLKEGAFTAEDRVIMSEHPEIGARILAGSNSPLLNMAAAIALSHHEWWDGSGYPRGLKGTDIPLEGRIVAVADVFDALRTARRYKPAYTYDEAKRIMESERGTHFEPGLVDAFFRNPDAIDEIWRRYGDD